jgi:HPt (histidine-containing phosphotransfer) domain-containing protein
MKQLDGRAIAVLIELQSATGRDLIAELVELYVSSTPEVIRKMRVDLEKRAFKELASAAHSLKSSSANLGVKFVEEIAKSIEISIVKHNSTDEVKLGEWISEIEKAYELAAVELQKI